MHGPDLWALHMAQRPASSALDLLSEIISLAGNVFLTAGLTTALAAGLYIRGRRSLALRFLAALAAITVVLVALHLLGAATTSAALTWLLVNVRERQTPPT